MISGVRSVNMLLAAAVILATLAGSASADWGETEIQVYCYAGDRNDNNYLGVVDVFSLNNLSGHCNVMYGDCNGSCTACYDDDAAREVCVDNSGIPYYY